MEMIVFYLIMSVLILCGGMAWTLLYIEILKDMIATINRSMQPTEAEIEKKKQNEELLRTLKSRKR